MNNKIKSFAFVVAVVCMGFMACTKKLDLKQINTNNPDVAYATPAAYLQSLAKVYSGYALTSSSGPDQSDIANIDAGTSDYFRTFWKLQELSTDEAVVGWTDPGIPDIHAMSWTADNKLTSASYSRSMLHITYCNEFLRESTAAKLAARNITGTDAINIARYRAEVRFLRAYQYWSLMDLYGSPAFATETTLIGGTAPNQISRGALFTYVENELKAIEPELAAARTNQHGRADRAACNALLARIYLNAAVYTGTPRYADAAIHAKKVIDVAGFSLINNYRELMLADNHTNVTENILTINYDGLRTQTYGGTTFLTNASIGGSMSAGDYGTSGGWAGLRTTKSLVNLFPDVSGSTDKRAQFFTNGQSLEINNIALFTDGYAITKYRNKTKAGVNGSNGTFSDADMPIFRLSEMYLIYAEAFARGAAGTTATEALTYVNNMRTRAYGNNTGNLPNAAAITPDFVLDERARELYWEGHRRTDLVRYNRFTTGTYLWPWKGGASGGTAVGMHRNLYPIPNSELLVNTNLVQNSPLY